MSIAKAEKFFGQKIPKEAFAIENLKPNLHQRNPVYQSWLYPLFGLYRLCSDLSVARPILWSTTVAVVQSGIITAGYTYVSFKYVKWFVSRHLLNFSYFNLRPLFQGVQYVTAHRLSAEDMEWYTAAILTLFQAAILSNSLIGYRIRAQGKRAGDAVLSTRPRNKQINVKTRETQERTIAGNFLWRFVKNTIWNTVILPIYTIPVAGQLIYAFIRAPNITARYLSMFNAHEIASSHRFGVIGFGILAGLLSGIPFVGHIFSISNSVGAAMWIQDLENEAGESDGDHDMTEST